MGAGRPKKTLGDLPDNWKEIMISIAKVGGSNVEAKVELGCISNDLWTRFIEEEPEFSETVEQCKILCQSWWEKFGRLNLITEKGESVNSTIYTFNMKNRFGWKDKQEVSADVTSKGDKIQSIAPHQFFDS